MNSYPRNPKYDFPEELVSGNKEYTFKLKGKNREGQAVYDMIDNKTGETVGSEYSFSDNIGLKRIAYSVERPIELEEIKEFFSKPLDEATKEESYMISKGGPKSNPYYVLEKPDGSKQIDMMFTSPEEAKKYATKKNLKISSKPGYNMKEAKKEEGLTPLQQYVYDFESDVSGEDFAEEEKENIMNLKTVSDVKNYYSDGRGWMDDSSLRETLINLLMDLSSKFPNLKEATKEEETKFHKKLDTLVHNTFGKRKGEMEEVVNYSPEGKDKIYSLISQALQQGKLTKDAQAVFMKWMADPNSTEEAIIKALESITGNRNVEETLVKKVMERLRKS